MKVKSESEVAQSCLTLSDPMDCSLPGSSVHGIFQARVLEWVAIVFSKNNCRSSQKDKPGAGRTHKGVRKRRDLGLLGKQVRFAYIYM